ncbi:MULTISPECIES: asparaginase domain-containing protein [unclassified Vibrio]|uniref:Asparaginase domain-containing protein n=1 Tax=Vibrio sp. HB236076 TaxID=3232307 RepID=A0AB39HC99_9VIBR|nr:asparaginase domain-containing protein [Vibrio sp. HB161653]MDP5254448.1 asparaginase domain-containing protein [Vibrio sp. HB161653]
MNHKFQLILTGGTIDSYYDTERCTPIPHQHSVIADHLKDVAGMQAEQFDVTTVCMKDSREIEDKDIDQVVAAIEQSPLNRHVITHGSFTLFTSARYLQSRLQAEHQQVIVFTGAMIPLAGFSPNDASFNLGSAITAAQCLEPGVYIAFHGKIYRPEDMENLH